MDKSPDAFRTISEVSEVLDTPAHVLRFWESRFPQIRPVKRAGGRRYYRPSDVALLTGIKRLLHDEGLTIRGVQKILREQGVRHVAGLTDDQITPDDAIDETVLAHYLGATDDAATDDDADDDAADAAGQQTVLPFPTPAPKPPEPPPQAAEPPAQPPAPRPAPIDDSQSFASKIRHLPRGSLRAKRGTIAGFARQLIILRTKLADRIEGGQG